MASSNKFATKTYILTFFIAIEPNNYIGTSGTSDIFPFITLPSSEPSTLICDEISEHELEFTWSLPLKVAPNVTIDRYEFIAMYCTNKKQKNKKQTREACDTGKF